MNARSVFAATLLAIALPALAPAQSPAPAASDGGEATIGKTPLPSIVPAWAETLPETIRKPLMEVLQTTGGFAFLDNMAFSATAKEDGTCFFGEFKGMKVTATEKPLSAEDAAAGKKSQWDVEIEVESMRFAGWKDTEDAVLEKTLMPPPKAPQWQKWTKGGVVFRDVVYVDKDRFVWPDALKQRMEKNNGNDANGLFPIRPSSALLVASQKWATLE